MIYRRTKIVLAGCIAALISSCSSSSSDSGKEDAALFKGTFIDSPVEGLDYTVGANSGATNSLGEFEYSAGDSITFAIGNIVFPTVVTKEQLSPYDLVENAEFSTDMVTNIARFLQTIDIDGDTSNGITVPQAVKDQSVEINFDVPAQQFENNSDVINLVANSGSPITTLISATQANDHLNTTLGIEGNADIDTNEIAGYWDFDATDDFVDIKGDGPVVFYDYETLQSCYTTRNGTLSRVEGTIYMLESEGDTRQIVITRDGDNLNILLVGNLTLSAGSPSALMFC